MSGALLQLASIGSQDAILTSNPEISLFKKEYKRYTNFATLTQIINFDGNNINFGETKTATIDNSGDLIYKIVLVLKLKQNTDKEWGYVNKLGHAIINNIKVTIGGTEIDNHFGDWIDIYNQLYRNASHDDNYNKMIGNIPEMKRIDSNHDEYTLYIPLYFWCSKASFLTFPTCALRNQDFQLTVTLNSAIDCINYKQNNIPTNLPEIISSYFLVDYVYLDLMERNLFQTDIHYYLIENVQEMTDTVDAQISRYPLTFDHPSKYIIWASNLNRFYERNKFLAFAFDDDFEKARNDFAKLIWLCSRNGLNMDSTPKIVINDTFINIGESPSLISGGNSIIETMANKVTAILLFTETVNDQITANATLENVVLTSNNITFEDMSTTIDELKKDSLSTTEQNSFLDYYTLNIKDVFNYGNFINRTDNPIVTSQLLLNGREKFQEIDGHYFNNNVPYHYFENKPSDGVNVYNFSLKPMDVETSGTIHFGKINDNKELIIKMGKNNLITNTYFTNYFKSGRIRIFSYNYSLLTVSPSLNTITLT